MVCSVTDDCDPDPLLEALLLVSYHEVTPDGDCVEVIDEVDVECGEIVEIQLVAPPCPALPPASPQSPVSANSEGEDVIMGESVVLELTATDACGNQATDTYDPASEPLPCPPIGQPPGPDCPVPLCGDEP